MPQPKGPFLTMASFCENALLEPDGVFSAIRLVDQLTLTLQGAEEIKGQEIPTFLAQPWFLVRFASEGLSAQREFKLVVTTPTGTESTMATHTVFFQEGQLGTNIRVKMALQIKDSGTYWFAVYLDDQKMGQAPLRIMHQPTQTGTTSKPSSS